MKIWERYFYKTYIITTLTILFSIYGLYIIIDMMAHLHSITESISSFIHFIEYYMATFSKRLHILLPFSLLIATIRVLYTFQQRGELVAMLASGVSYKTLMKPFLIVALSASCILYTNYQWILPEALPIVEEVTGNDQSGDDAYPKEVMLTDGSKLVYNSYSSRAKLFNDLFWILSPDEIYHMKTLSTGGDTPTGHFVDHIKRGKSGSLEKITSYDSLLIPSMRISSHFVKTSVIPPPEQSLSQLLKQTILYFGSNSTKASEITANFFYKLSLPLLCILAFIAPAPFCLRFTRSLPILMTYLLAIAGLFCMTLVLQAAFILGKSQTVTPFIAIAIPWIVVGYYFGKKYVQL